MVALANAPSNNSVGNEPNWGDRLNEKVKGKQPNGNLKGVGKGSNLVNQAAVANKGGSSSSSGGSGGYGGGGGGGGGVAPAPSKDEVRSVIMAGMKSYLGREATAKETKAFFKKFTEYSAKNENSVNADMTDEFMQDWIDDRPKLRKEYAQFSTATKYMSALDRAMSSVKEL